MTELQYYREDTRVGKSCGSYIEAESKRQKEEEIIELLVFLKLGD